MFTGIVQAIGTVRAATPRDAGCDLTIACDGFDAPALAIGESIAVSGVCLSVAETRDGAFTANVVAETLRRTTIGTLRAGDRVNLERALAAGDRLGGHIVAGHVDGVGTITRRTTASYGEEVELEVPREIARYVAEKGSIAVDGVSLTVGEVRGARCVLYLIPHTLSATIAAAYAAGTRVNVEVDVISRYVERLLRGEAE